MRNVEDEPSLETQYWPVLVVHGQYGEGVYGHQVETAVADSGDGLLLVSNVVGTDELWEIEVPKKPVRTKKGVRSLILVTIVRYQ